MNTHRINVDEPTHNSAYMLRSREDTLVLAIKELARHIAPSGRRGVG